MAQFGKDLLLKIEDAGTFKTIGGMRSNNFSINDETVDVSSKDSNGFREYMAGAGLRSVSASGSGIFKDAVMMGVVNTKMLAGQHANWQIIVPGFGAYEGSFAISSLSMSGEYNGELSFDLSLESAGEISFTAS